MCSNDFPKIFVDSFIGKQLNKLLMTTQAVPVHTVNKGNLFIPLIYTGKQSIIIRQKLLKLLKPFYPQLNVRVIFRTKNIIGNFFKFKDRVPECLQSSIIYKYTCGTCQSTYLGRTERQFGVRISEHLNRSFRTNNPLSKPPYSAIRQHSENSNHALKKENFSIVTSAKNRTELIILEALYTHLLQPNIVKQENPSHLLCFPKLT